MREDTEDYRIEIDPSTPGSGAGLHLNSGHVLGDHIGVYGVWHGYLPRIKGRCCFSAILDHITGKDPLPWLPLVWQGSGNSLICENFAHANGREHSSKGQVAIKAKIAKLNIS